MDAKELEKITREIQTVHDNMLQAMKLYTDITLRRWKALENINKIYFISADKDQINTELKALTLCHNQERRLMTLIELSIPITYKSLKKITQDKKKELDREERELLKSMFRALDYVLKKIHLVKDRIKKEEKFIASQSEESFGALHSVWKKEKKCDEELLKIINPAYLSKWEHLKNVNGYLNSQGRNAIKGAVVGSIFSAAFMLGGAMDLDNAAFTTMWGIAIGNIYGIIKQYREETAKIYAIQQEAILRFRKK